MEKLKRCKKVQMQKQKLGFELWGFFFSLSQTLTLKLGHIDKVKNIGAAR